MEQTSESRTLWIGALESWMDESFLNSLIVSLGYGKELSSIKIIKDKVTGMPAKYGFLQFQNHEIASNFYQNYNNKQIPNSIKTFKLNWAAYGGSSRGTLANKITPQEMSIYVGDLDLSVTEHKLLEFFRVRYPSAFMSKIITDNLSKASKGYGFVKFTNQEEAQKAIQDMNGQQLLGRPIKVSNAYLKTKQQQNGPDNEEMESQIADRLKLYQQFYSMTNDPQLKAEYERQIQKTFGIEDATKKMSLKQSLQTVQTLTYDETRKSEEFLEYLPKRITYRAKRAIEARIYS